MRIAADLLPDDLAFAVPAFWTGLLYNEANLSAALDLGAGINDHGAWRRAMDSAAKNGLDGEIDGRPLREQAVRLLEMVRAAYRDGAVRCAGDGDTALAALAALENRHGLDGAD